MLMIKQETAITRRKIILVALSAAGFPLGLGLFAYLTRSKDPALWKVLRLPAKGRHVAWSPDGKRLAVVMIDEPLVFGKKKRALQLWDLEQGENDVPVTRSALQGWFGDVLFSPDGKTIAAAVTEVPQAGRPISRPVIEDALNLWDAKTLTLKQTLGIGGLYHLSGFAFSPDGKLLAAGEPGKKTILLWNTQTGSLERTLNTGTAQPWSLAFSPDGKALIVGGQQDNRTPDSQADVRLISGQVQWWDAQSWSLTRALKQDQYVNTVAISANGKLLAGGGGGDLIQLWDAQTGELVHSLQGLESGTRFVAFSPDGLTVAAGGKDGKVFLWDVRTGRLKATLKVPGWGWLGTSEIYSVAFSPDGKTLASTGNDGTVCLWKMSQGVAEK